MSKTHSGVSQTVLRASCTQGFAAVTECCVTSHPPKLAASNSNYLFDCKSVIWKGVARAAWLCSIRHWKLHL